MDEVTIRLVIAVLLWLAAAVLVVGKLVISLGHAFYALQNDTALASDNRAPLRYAVTAMLAASLTVAGFLVWVPELVRLLPFGLGVILLFGLSSYVNWKIRQHYSRKRSAHIANNP
mgnify:FL=1|jgi:hypothetical protein